MSKVIKVLGILIVVGAVVAIGVVAVQAQENRPKTPRESGDCECNERGGGMGRGRGMGNFPIGEESVHERLAEALGITEEEFETAIAEGETLLSLAEKYDVDYETLRQVMLEARQEALEEAVAEGKITQEQADWMLERWNAMGEDFAPRFDSQGSPRFQSFGGGRMGRSGECQAADED